jgi:hypothetical protein
VQDCTTQSDCFTLRILHPHDQGRLFDRVRANWSRFLTVRGGDGKWIEIAPGVQFKLLHDDGRVRSFLLRLAAGARLPAHSHSADEACIVVEASARLGDVEVQAGDFHLACEGSVHGEVTSRTGALLFLHGASTTRVGT